MRRGFAIIALLVLIFGGIGIGVGAYRAGERNGITEGIEQVHVAQQNGQREYEDGARRDSTACARRPPAPFSSR